MQAMNTAAAAIGDTAADTVARSRTRVWILGLGALVAVVAVVVFLPVLDNGFVDWDDEKNIVKNFNFQGWGWTYFRWAWTTFLLGVYQPLGWLLLELQYVGWALEPRGYHAVSLVLHGVNAVLVYGLTLTLLKRGDPGSTEAFPRATAAAAALSTSLFAVHPLRTEPIAWVSSQTYLPCAMFCLLSVLAYLRSVPASDGARAAHRGWLAASLVLFLAALLNKAAAMGLPMVLLALDIYPLRRFAGAPRRWLARENRTVWIEKLPFFALSLAFAVVAFAAKQHGSMVEGVATATPKFTLPQLAQSCQAIALYIEKTLLPLGISPYYAALPYVDLGSLSVVFSIVWVLAVTALLFTEPRRWPALTAAWFSYMMLLAPTLGIVRYSGQLAADRYSYVPIIALHVVFAWALLRVAARFATRPSVWRHAAAGVALATIGVLVVGLSSQSWTLSKTWRDSETLWTFADEHAGGRTVAEVQNYLALAKLKKGQTEEAMRRFAEAVRLRPTYADAHHNQAVVWATQGDYVRAEAGFRQTLSLNPQHREAQRNLALALQRQGRVNEAVAEYAEALRKNPRNELLQEALVTAKSQPGVDPAVAVAAARVSRDPADVTAHAALAEGVKRTLAR
jgi:protein O-mannosyl-transferase